MAGSHLAFILFFFDSGVLAGVCSLDLDLDRDRDLDLEFNLDLEFDLFATCLAFLPDLFRDFLAALLLLEFSFWSVWSTSISSDPSWVDSTVLFDFWTVSLAASSELHFHFDGMFSLETPPNNVHISVFGLHAVLILSLCATQFVLILHKTVKPLVPCGLPKDQFYSCCSDLTSTILSKKFKMELWHHKSLWCQMWCSPLQCCIHKSLCILCKGIIQEIKPPGNLQTCRASCEWWTTSTTLAHIWCITPQHSESYAKEMHCTHGTVNNRSLWSTSRSSSPRYQY